MDAFVSACIWLVWAILAIGTGTVLEVWAFTHGKRSRLSTLSTTVHRGQTRHPWLRKALLVAMTLLWLSWPLLVVHWYADWP